MVKNTEPAVEESLLRNLCLLWQKLCHEFRDGRDGYPVRNTASAVTETLSGLRHLLWWNLVKNLAPCCYRNLVRSWMSAVKETQSGIRHCCHGNPVRSSTPAVTKTHQKSSVCCYGTLSGIWRLLLLVRNTVALVLETLLVIRGVGGIDILIGYLYLKLCIFPKFSCPGKLAKLTNCDPVFWLTFEYLPGYALNFHANTPSASLQKLVKGSSWSEGKIYAMVNRSANTM